MRNVVLMTLAACLLLAGAAFAADENVVPAAKIGVVDMQTVATQSEPAQAAKKSDGIQIRQGAPEPGKTGRSAEEKG